jgi:outer membrane protein assembly factor BamA
MFDFIPILLLSGLLDSQGVPSLASAQEVPAAITESQPEAASREELLVQARLDKEKHLTPYKLSKFEKRMASFETKGFRESLGLRFVDFYFSQGGLTTGAGIGATARYFRANLGDLPFDVSLSAGYTLKQYQLYTFQFGNILRKSPDLFLRQTSSGGVSLFDKTKEREGNLFLYAEISYRDFTEEDYYGLGNDSSESNRSDYRISGPSYEGVGAFRITPRLAALFRAGYFQPELRTGKDSTIPPTQDVFDETTAPGLDEQPNFFRFASQVFYDYRDIAGNPNRGGLLGFTYARAFDLSDQNQFSFYRLTFDARQYLPLWSEQRMFAFRFYTSFDTPVDNGQVPFYLMQTLGGSDSLRGYPDFRFRDQNLLLLSGEYRWEPAPPVELVLFYDTGKVFPEHSDFSLSDLKYGYGFGIRLKTETSVQVRIDIGHSKEGTNFYLKWVASF